ncbi:MAG: anthranilate synthase component I [Deltaproteobacteria bacterium]|nr:anthranilate synthase component I [Deltaproteobacteria bacterium]MCB9489380.1 anthranilate synthase component I [Deltaproteobacteria bacterium]
MIRPTKEKFAALAEQGDLVPVYARFHDDLDTPVSAYLTLADYAPGQRFLLESVEGGENIGRYSFLGLAPHTILVGKNGKAKLTRNGKTTDVEYGDKPLEMLKDLLSDGAPVPDPSLPPFVGGAVGYMGYDTVRHFEKLPADNPDTLDLPDFYFLFPDVVVAFDRVTHEVTVGTYARVGNSPDDAYTTAVAKVKEVVALLKGGSHHQPVGEFAPFGDEAITSNFKREDFLKAVEATKEYILDGDSFQTVLSQRFTAPMNGKPFDVYRRLRSVNPSPYMFYLDLDGFQLVGASPEVHVKVTDGKVTLRPIAGTRPRGRSEAEDARLERDLLADEKELAEHVMLVDLGRNDLSRVCEAGTVNVTEKMVIERYSHVMHIVSNVEGRLSPQYDAYDALAATFPAGTVSGAPKVRSMEIIEELEPDRRGPYAGVVGYFSNSGNLDSCITIRTILIQGDKAHVQAGAGLVADSDPATEYEETRNKAMAMLRSLGYERPQDREEAV